MGSTEEVARRAGIGIGIGIGIVFRHFPTKQLLIRGTMLRHLALLTETARARSEARDPGGCFRTTFRELVYGAPAKLALLVLLEESTGSSDRADEVEVAGSVLREAVAVLLRRGQVAGEVRADATIDVVYVLIGALANVEAVLDGLSPRRFA